MVLSLNFDLKETLGTVQILEDLQEHSFMWGLLLFSRHAGNIGYMGTGGKGQFCRDAPVT